MGFFNVFVDNFIICKSFGLGCSQDYWLDVFAKTSSSLKVFLWTFPTMVYCIWLKLFASIYHEWLGKIGVCEKNSPMA